MSQEISISAGLTINKPVVMSSPKSLSFPNVTADMNGDEVVYNSGQGIATTSTALNLGAVTAPHFGAFQNNDGSNTIFLLNGADTIGQFNPGDVAIFPFFPGVSLHAISTPSPTFGLEFLVGSL